MNRGTDWIAWFFQAVVGLVVGALFGLFVVARKRGFIIETKYLADFLWGAGLLGAGLAARWGDLLWSSYRVIPIDEPSQTWVSKLAAFGVGAAGVGLMALALGRNFHLISF
jgi:hypothetical protein